VTTHPIPPQGDAPGSAFVREDIRAKKAAAKAARDKVFAVAVERNTSHGRRPIPAPSPAVEPPAVEPEPVVDGPPFAESAPEPEPAPKVRRKG